MRSSTVVASRATGGPPLRRNRDYRWLWLGQSVSLLGDEIFDTTMVLWVGTVVARDAAWAPVSVAGVLAAATVPVVLFSSIGGAYADRWDRRRTMLVADAVRCVLVGGLAAVTLIGWSPSSGALLAIVYVVVALAATAAQFFNPARFGLLAVVVADADRERMSSVAAASSALASIVGPSIAAALLVTAGAGWSLLCNAMSFGFSFVAVAMVRTRPVPRPTVAAGGAVVAGVATVAGAGVRRELVVGIRFVARHRLLRVLLGTTVAVMAGVSAINALDIFFVTRNLRAPAEMYGILATALGLGTMAGAVLTGLLSRHLRAARVYAYGLLAIGVLMVGYSRTTSPAAAIVVLVLTGVPSAAVNSMIGPLILRATPVELLGRVSSVFQPATRLAALLSITLAGWLATTVLRDLDASLWGVHVGTIDGVFLVAGLIIVASGAWALHALRDPDRQAAAPHRPAAAPDRIDEQAA